MAILEHIASKSADYREAQRYLIFQHDEYTVKPFLDKNGKIQLREEYYLDGVECDPFSFDMECRELNACFHKNQKYNEIKSHHFIISFDPKDGDECGLTGKQVQQLGYLVYLKQSLIDLCLRENLYQVDLLTKTEWEMTEKEYHTKRSGQKRLEERNRKMISEGTTPRTTVFQTQKQYLRTTSSTDFSTSLLFKYFLLHPFSFRLHSEQKLLFAYAQILSVKEQSS